MNILRLCFFILTFITLDLSAALSSCSSDSSVICSDQSFDDLSLAALIEQLYDVAHSPEECAERREYIRVLKPAAEKSFNDFVLFACAFAHAKDTHASPEKIHRLINRIKQVYKELLLELEELDIEDEATLRAEYLVATAPSFADAAQAIGFDDFKDWYLKEGYREFLSRSKEIYQTIAEEAHTHSSPTNCNRLCAFHRLYRATIQYSIVKDYLTLEPPILQRTRTQIISEFSWFYMFSIRREA